MNSLTCPDGRRRGRRPATGVGSGLPGGQASVCRQLGAKGKRLRVDRGRSMACREAAELCGMKWGGEHAGRAGRDLPPELGEESSRHAVQLGRPSDDDLGLVRWSAPSISTSPKVDSDLPCTQRFDSHSSNFWIGDSEIHMLTHHHACRAAAHGFRPAKFSSRRHACAMPWVCASKMCGEAWQAEREREGRDRQHWSAGEVPSPGGACGFAPWSLRGAPAARRATGEP